MYYRDDSLKLIHDYNPKIIINHLEPNAMIILAITCFVLLLTYLNSLETAK